VDERLILLMPLAFACEFIDSSLGMGYGTSLTPILLLLGFHPLQIVPAVLLSEFVTGLTAAFTHHSLRNVNFNPRSKDTKVALALSTFAVAGTIASVLIAVKLPPYILKTWIGIIVIVMGVAILVALNRRPKFSWGRIAVLGTVASFNKGMSGGGYGPVVMGGQILSGISVKNAVGITSLSESVTCLVGVIMYLTIKSSADWVLAPWLMAGAVLSVPLAAHTLKRIPEKKGKIAVAVIVILLGCLTLAKVILGK
jgi:uncharacterized membrane protein YfcA